MAEQQDIAQPGDVIGGRYEVLSVLGRGGFGVVYHARSTEHGREFALKTYLKSSLDRRAIARFRQESEIWIALGAHPYLVQAYFADEIEGRLYVGMEMIRPGTEGINDLEGYIKQGGVTLEQSLRWAIQLCYGMEYAALRGIRAHRDLKPANVMINDAGAVKVNDFGLATQPGSVDAGPAPDERRQLAQAFRGQTMHGIGFGTPTHMPPEQFEDAAACDARSDIYSTGVMLYQLVTGQLPVTLPWPTDSSLETRMRFWKDMEAAHRAFECPPLNSPLRPIIARCMAAEPENRYADFGALRVDLARVLQALGGVPVEEPMVRPLSVKGWISRGRSLARIGRFPQAIHAFEQAIAQEPSNAMALMGKAEALLELGQPTKAQPLYDNLLREDASNASAAIGKARCLQQRGYLNEALSGMEAAVRVQPEMSDGWRYRAELLMQLDSLDDASESFEKALALAPTDPDRLTGKGVLLARQGRAEDALAMFDRALTINPLHARASRGQAAALVACNRSEEALPRFRSLERNGDLTPALRLMRAEALARTGQAAAALNELEHVTEPEWQAVAGRMRVQVFVDLNRIDDALDEAESLQAGASGDIASRIQLLILRSLAGRNQEALGLTGDILATEPGNEAACAAACAAALHSGQDQQALQTCDYGLSFHPESSLLKYNRGLALTVLEQLDAARGSFELAERGANNTRIKEAAAFNRAQLNDRVQSTDQVRNSSGPSGPQGEAFLLSDDLMPTRPEATLRIQANGWHPRYRLPHLRPALYLFPRIMPPQPAF